MPRFFIGPGDLADGRAAITGGDARHIAVVLHCRVGDPLELAIAGAGEFLGTIVSSSPERVEVEVGGRISLQDEPDVRVTLYQCLPKGDKMDSIVQKCVELGVNRVVPVLSKRCVSRPDAGALQNKRRRWQQIAAEAAKQARRGIVPEVGECIALGAALRGAPGSGHMLYVGEAGALFAPLIEGRGDISLFIGPEGGFDPAEADLARACGARICGLGPRILRTETAGMAAIAIIMHLSGNM